MKTKQIYLDDSYLKEMDAEVLEIKTEPDGSNRLLLDQTVFYPMGGGQPTDQGQLKTDSDTWEVYMVMNKDGEIWHYIKSENPPKVGDKVHGIINWDRRYKNMRVHSAGHILDFAIFTLGYAPTPLMPSKGDHGKKAFIEYSGIVNEDIKHKIEDKANKLIRKDLKFSWLFQPLAELEKEAIYLLPGLPTNKPLRTLRLETIGAVADGGTQVHSTNEVGEIKIDSVEIKDNNTVINYSLKV